MMGKAERDGLGDYLRIFVNRFFMHDEEVAERLGPMTRQMMGETPVPIAQAQARALDTRREMVPLIDGFPGPVEVIVGAEDRICPPLLHHPVAAALPVSVLTEIPG